jgi:hypothetical protein
VEPVLIPKLNVVKSLAADRPAGLILEIDIGQLLRGAVDYDKARFQFVDRPGRREAACYSITWSARASRVVGSLRPSVFAVAKLMISLKCVGS